MEVSGPWSKVFSPQHQTYYYYNSVTHESTWTVPADWKPTTAPVAHTPAAATTSTANSAYGTTAYGGYGNTATSTSSSSTAKSTSSDSQSSHSDRKERRRSRSRSRDRADSRRGNRYDDLSTVRGKASEDKGFSQRSFEGASSVYVTGLPDTVTVDHLANTCVGEYRKSFAVLSVRFGRIYISRLLLLSLSYSGLK